MREGLRACVGEGSRRGAGKLPGSEAGEGCLRLSGSSSPGPYLVVPRQSSRVTFIASRPWRGEKSGRRSRSAIRKCTPLSSDPRSCKCGVEGETWDV